MVGVSLCSLMFTYVERIVFVTVTIPSLDARANNSKFLVVVASVKEFLDPSIF